jgi:hypothetical protein
MLQQKAANGAQHAQHLLLLLLLLLPCDLAAGPV